MSRLVPFDHTAKCDDCGAVGAYDFMGDLLCPKCAAVALEVNDQPAREDGRGELSK